jgi:hypothetical protein
MDLKDGVRVKQDGKEDTLNLFDSLHTSEETVSNVKRNT